MKVGILRCIELNPVPGLALKPSSVQDQKAPILCAKDRGFTGYEMSLRERVAYSALMRTIRFQTFSP